MMRRKTTLSTSIAALAAAALALASTARAAPSQVRLGFEGPADTSVTVLWRAPEPTGAVEFGAASGPTSDLVRTPTKCSATAALSQRVDAVATAFEGGYLHRAQLTGLAPATRYQYRCGTAGNWSPTRSFETAPPVGAKQGFRFIAMGDSRGEDPARERIRDAVAARSPAFAIHLGDLVGDGREQASWDGYFAMMEPLAAAVPIALVAGNHEHNAPRFWQQIATPEHSPAAEGYAPGAYYSFDYGAVHFVVLSTEPPGPADGPQARWIDADLARARADARIRWIVAFGHRPPFSSGRHGPDSSVRKALVPVLEKYDVDLALFSHDHDYERFKPLRGGKPAADGVTYIVSGGAGAPLYGVAAGRLTAASRSVHHFLDIDVSADRLEVAARGADGAVFDRVALKPRARHSRSP